MPAPPPPSATSTPAGQPTAITRLHMQLHLHDLQQNASDLRNQLQQLKKLQVGTGGDPNPAQLVLGWLQPQRGKIPLSGDFAWGWVWESEGILLRTELRAVPTSGQPCRHTSPHRGDLAQPESPPSSSSQLQNQETVKTMLRRTETEISVRVTDTMRKHEDPLQRQRSLVEEERLRYLNEEELITQQLK